MAVITFDKVDIVFGTDPGTALALLDQGDGKDGIYDKTGIVVGVTDASVAIEEGEIFVLMGLSGSGKSTLLRSVNRLNAVTRGRVLVHDGDAEIDIATCDAATLRRLRMNRVSMVFQQFALMPWRTVRDNVAYGLEIRGMVKAERYKRVEDVLELVRLGQWADKYPHELSGGMQQRVGLARAFATEAEILLMDEPFSALDPLIREHLQDELLEFQRRLQKTILFVSHDLDEALKIGTRIAIMESGRIVQVGRPEEIITRPSTDYVRQFVANVNPLNVLRAATLLRPLEKLARDPGDREAVLLDGAGRYRCRLDAEGRPAVLFDGTRQARATAHHGDLDIASLGADVVVTGTPETTMRVAVETCHRTGWPMPVLDAEGRLAGVVGSDELVAAMTRQRSRNDQGIAQGIEAVSRAG
jgi:glycine betaine/proline transport system ATP-binding protein